MGGFLFAQFAMPCSRVRKNKFFYGHIKIKNARTRESHETSCNPRPGVEYIVFILVVHITSLALFPENRQRRMVFVAFF